MKKKVAWQPGGLELEAGRARHINSISYMKTT